MEIWSSIVDFLKSIVTVFGGGLAIFGVINYAKAHSDSNGPEQSKAIGQIIGGAGVILAAQTLIPLLANMF